MKWIERIMTEKSKPVTQGNDSIECSWIEKLLKEREQHGNDETMDVLLQG